MDLDVVWYEDEVYVGAGQGASFSGGPRAGGVQAPSVIPRPAITEALKKYIIEKVTVDLISPKELSKRNNMSVERIRKIVRDAGHKLPNRYKVTSTPVSYGVGAETTNTVDRATPLLPRIPRTPFIVLR